MPFRRLVPLLALIALGAVAGGTVLLPTGWRITPSNGPVLAVGTFPQGIAISPDGTKLAILESGAAPPALRIADAETLSSQQVIPLKGAFGDPVWSDTTHVLVAGANAHGIYDVDLATGTAHLISLGEGTYPAAIALDPSHSTIAIVDDSDGTLMFRSLHGDTGLVQRLYVGPHPSAVLFSANGSIVYVAIRGGSSVAIVHRHADSVAYVHLGLHPCALARDATRLYVSECDDDRLRILSLATRATLADIPVGLDRGRVHGYGASPNAVAVRDGTIFVTLGQENAIAMIDATTHRVLRAPTGWYPTGIALGKTRLFITDGKGESSRPNPHYSPLRGSNQPEYVALAMKGSVRVLRPSDFTPASDATVFANAMPHWTAPPATIVHANGPIRHVFYVIKENRTYDEVLGDLGVGDGDPSLVWFGERITPNQHALARRFGVFDRTFADAQISADGHNWSTAAFANDYLERFWPVQYGWRRSLYDFEDGATASRPHNGYLWDDAARADVSLRDYGEFVRQPGVPVTTHMEHLIGKIDPAYPGFDLQISDQVRYRLWKTEFDRYVAHGNLPQLEIIRLPNDHTAATKPGTLTPQAYVASNDYALGQIVDAISHSPYWSSSVLFAIEDDAQDGADHVDDQRTTLYVASPYALAGVHHETYTTASVLHTIELLLGMQPMSVYDTVARPLYAAFGSTPNLQPFDAIRPHVDLHARNARTAYGAAQSERMDLRDADAVDPATFNAILQHVTRGSR